MPYAEASKWVAEAEPADKMRRICALHAGPEARPRHRHLALHEWWRLAGAHWNACTSIAEHVVQLRSILAHRSPLVVKTMMTTHEQQVLAALKDPVRVYRGCDSKSTDGICWTLSHDDARAYALRPGVTGSPMIVTGRVWIRDIVAVKLAGENTHVISFAVTRRGPVESLQE
jgi:hypothetical protein